MLIVGLGAGTVSKQFAAVYGPEIAIDGVEIDPKVIELGQQYFEMNEPNLKPIAADGRTHLQQSDKRYNVIAVDAYRQPYIPFHLVTREFFQEASDHLTPQGVLALNAGHTGKDFRLVEVLSSTMRTVFPHVYVIDLPTGYNNSLIYGTLQPISEDEIRASALATGNAALAEVANQPWQLRAVNETTVVYTDDLAPVERLIDDIIVREALGGARGRQR
jgi:spermidine synthase